MFQRISAFALIAGALLLGACATDQAPPASSQAAVNPSARQEAFAPSQPRAPVPIEEQSKARTAAPSIPPPPARELPRVEEPRRPTLTDAEIVSAIIRHSLAAYPGNCPCPDNVDRAGRRCGGRSAYSKPGGYAPLCYASDVTPAMIEAYRQRMR